MQLRGQMHTDSFVTYRFTSMSTNCTLQIYDKISEQKIKHACDMVKSNTLYLEKKYSFYDHTSYLHVKINNRKKSKIKLDNQSANVLKFVRKYSEKLNGIFDITVGTYKHCYNLKDLDKFYACVNELKQKSGLNSWNINKNFIEFSYPQTKLDLGGVIKEYAVDEAKNILKNQGINSAIINYGGDIYAIGTKPSGKYFTIGIKNPKDKTSNLLHININDCAITTSAHYERNYQIENENFSHILSENKSEILSSTVISESALKSGIYSTCFMIDTNIDIEEGLKVALVDNALQIHQNIYM